MQESSRKSCSCRRFRFNPFPSRRPGASVFGHDKNSSVWFERRNDKHQINRSACQPWQECAGFYREEITNISHLQDAMVSVMFVRSTVGGGLVGLVLVFAATCREMALRSVS